MFLLIHIVYLNNYCNMLGTNKIVFVVVVVELSEVRCKASGQSKQ